MSTLARINGEALSVPGLRFWGQRVEGRFAVIAQNEHGAVELWRSEVPGYDLGGVEIHSPVPLDPDDQSLDCTILGGPCWPDGSMLAYGRDFLPLIQSGDSAGVLRRLAVWHANQFGEAAS